MTDAAQIDDGGSAFPPSMAVSPSGDVHWSSQIGADTQGLSVREWFAGHALSGVITQCASDHDVHHYAGGPAMYFAKKAFEVADMMIAARNKSNSKGNVQTISVGTYTITELYSGRSVNSEYVALVPADDLKLLGGEGPVATAANDIAILLAQIDALQEASGETLDPEDAALVENIRASWTSSARKAGA